jgi:hypothetical protein
MSTVSQNLTQTSILNPYASAPCDDSSITSTLPCAAGDWSYSNRVCLAGQGPMQYNCSTIDTGLCPNIGNRPHMSTFSNPPNVTCTYDIASFQTPNDVNVWIATWGKDYNYNNTIMPYFCSRLSTNCPIDPLMSQKMNKCTQFASTDSSGSLCRDWAKNHPVVADSTMANACLQYDTADCLCEDRQRDPLYVDIERRLPAGIPDSCWWRPCTLPKIYAMNSNNDIDAVCPADICNTVRNIIKTNGLNKKYSSVELEEKIACSISGPTNNTSTSTIVWIIVIITIVILMIIFIALLWK